MLAIPCFKQYLHPLIQTQYLAPCAGIKVVQQQIKHWAFSYCVKQQAMDALNVEEAADGKMLDIEHRGAHTPLRDVVLGRAGRAESHAKGSEIANKAGGRGMAVCAVYTCGSLRICCVRLLHDAMRVCV